MNEIKKTFTDADVTAAVVDYAIHHEVETDRVAVERSYQDGRLVGFRLSLDVHGRSAGQDETYGTF